jgi:RNA polymerase sigma factor (sigma-70 family)
MPGWACGGTFLRRTPTVEPVGHNRGGATDSLSDMALTDAELYRQAATDGDAFGELYDRYERPLLAYFMREVRNAELAADLTAETFAALLVARRSDKQIDEPRAWLYGTGRRKLVDAYRDGVVDDRMRRRLGLERIVLDDAALLEIESLDDTAHAELAALPEEQRAAVEARVIEERSYEEIAQAIGCSQAVVRKRVSRGLSLLRSRLQEQS